MRITIAAACAAVLLACGPGRHPAGPPLSAPPASEAAPVAPPPVTSPEVGFASDVQPILERCRPCHFEGGTMYDKLPFDNPDTIRSLGTALFTRIKDEREQAIINAFLAQVD